MKRSEALERLRSHRGDLQEMGIEHVSVFGSVARDQATPSSDLDLAIRLRADVRLGWDYATLPERIAALIGVRVDIVTVPTHRARLQAEIDRDRVDAF
ncbi:nucleotidyltransferase family protein [uncultured Sphingomonas sp.]|uniref:nucleotidyltransferase family protein n=1 Tax=uncultured Sphingomonas sp. TaxID=158754 RepID=UPI0035CB99DD